MKALLALVALAGCVDDVDPPWQLDHDRIIAVRASPPHVVPGGVALLDALVAHRGGPTSIESPTAATAAGAPADLFLAVHFDLDHWQVEGPADAQLADARAALALAAGAPVPLDVSLQFRIPQVLAARKRVWLGDAADNPALGAVTVAGMPAGSELVVDPDVDLPLAVEAPAGGTVNWLSSCGTLHDDTAPAAILHVKPADPQQGELVVVVRDPAGGVAWQVWPIRTK